MSRGFSGGKQVKNLSAIATGGSDHFTSFDAVAAVDVLAVNNKDANRVKTRTVHFA